MSASAHTPPRRWTTKQLVDWLTAALTKKGVDSPRLVAELLVAHALGCERMQLYLQPDRPATLLERETLRQLAKRALAHEPVQYLTGQAWFYSLRFKADHRALIPRPCTETLVDAALRHAKLTPGAGRGLYVDLCTGSGVVAIALLKNLPHARAIATDIDEQALALARENAQLHGVLDRLELRRGDLFEALETPTQVRSAQAILANPPYIPDTEWDEVAAMVREHEPARALRGGPEGLDYVAPIVEGAAQRLAPGGLLAVEIAAASAAKVEALARAQPQLADVRIERDLEGLPRTLLARRAGPGGPT